MSNPLVTSKGTKKNYSLGPFGAKRGGGAGKGDIISGTFGDRWIKNIEGRLAQRMYACEGKGCGVIKPSGKCDKCGHDPYPKGW